MAFERTNWNAGTIEKPAHVVIDGTEYEVIPEERKGATPINIPALENIENGIVENEESINNYANGNTPMGDIVVDSIKTTNLLDENAITQGAVHATNGSNVDGTNRLRTALTKVETEQMTISWNETSLSCYGVFCYDENGSFLGNVSASWQTTPYTFTPLNNTKYVKFAWRKNDDSVLTKNSITKVQLEKGSVVTDYSKHIEFYNLENTINYLITTKKVTKQQVSFKQGINTLTFDMTNPGYTLIGIVCIDNSNDSSWEPYIQKYSIHENNAYITFVNTNSAARTFNVTVTGLYIKTPSVATTSEAAVMSISEEIM